MAGQNEKRKFPRVIKAYFTAVKWYEDSGEPKLADIGETINISEGGIFLEVSKAAPFLSSLSLHLGFDNEILKVDGEVVHLKVIEEDKIEMGIKFLNLEKKGVELIRRSILKNNEAASGNK